MKSFSGIFISFEGIDFSGKTEQARRLFETLRAVGYDTELLREPGGVEIAEAIRQILLDAKHSGMTERTEILLYSAARAQITKEKIQPLLAAGKIIIADRFVDSTTAFQGFGRQIDLDFVRRINRFVTWELLPDVTFLLHIPLAVAETRQRQSGKALDRLEREDRAFHERVLQGYLQLAQAEPQRFVVLDGTQSLDAVSQEVKATLRQRFDLKI
ncbi:MAG: dTMP kinase [candidate division KSB1 bacterium]|nr:dTMP kinase [candidate division KSB1 bacterium]MDZ7368810.1 dTMP kinase [candidate division KSB1 bacterium]MDZ7406654.1 dTMP kinase [candidate division KSB1 bacterium]